MVPCVEVIANALGPREASPRLFHSLSMLHNNTRAAVSHRAMLVVQSRLLNISPAFVCFNKTFLNQNISNTAAASGGFNPPTPPKLKRVRPQTKHRSQPATFLKQHVKHPPEFTEHKPVTSTKTKPAASIEQSSNGAIESNLQIEPSKLQRFLRGPRSIATGRHRPPQGGKPSSQRVSKYHMLFIKILIFHLKSA